MNPSEEYQQRLAKAAKALIVKDYDDGDGEPDQPRIDAKIIEWAGKHEADFDEERVSKGGDAASLMQFLHPNAKGANQAGANDEFDAVVYQWVLRKHFSRANTKAVRNGVFQTYKKMLLRVRLSRAGISTYLYYITDKWELMVQDGMDPLLSKAQAAEQRWVAAANDVATVRPDKAKQTGKLVANQSKQLGEQTRSAYLLGIASALADEDKDAA